MASSGVTINADNAIKNFKGFVLKDGQDSIDIAAGNGATGGNFGPIPGGTYMGKASSGTISGQWRPVGKQLVADAYTGVSPVMANTRGFYVGDVVTAYDVSGSTNLYTGRTITAIDRTTGAMTISGASQAYEVGDYIYVEDGSATARGVLDEAGADTYRGRDINGDQRFATTGGTMVYRGVMDETITNANQTLNALIKADLQNKANGCDILFR